MALREVIRLELGAQIIDSIGAVHYFNFTNDVHDVSEFKTLTGFAHSPLNSSDVFRIQNVVAAKLKNLEDLGFSSDWSARAMRTLLNDLKEDYLT